MRRLVAKEPEIAWKRLLREGCGLSKGRSTYKWDKVEPAPRGSTGSLNFCVTLFDLSTAEFLRLLRRAAKGLRSGDLYVVMHPACVSQGEYPTYLYVGFMHHPNPQPWMTPPTPPKILMDLCPVSV